MTTTCPTCSNSFTPRRPWQRFCGDRCRRAHHKGNGQEAERVAKLERRVTELEEAVAMIRGHLVL
jgi:endogenous inhibitor of DNA gyrase (YacG/DUF329 family)